VNLAPAECWLLFRIDEHGPITPQDLAACLDLSESDLHPHLQILREKELITGGDEHAPLAVSPEGRCALEKLVEARREDLNELLEGWSPEEHEELARLLERLARELLRDDSEPKLAHR
jgi:DNA-binding MarR family transcriptional regulator